MGGGSVSLAGLECPGKMHWVVWEGPGDWTGPREWGPLAHTLAHLREHHPHIPTQSHPRATRTRGHRHPSAAQVVPGTSPQVPGTRVSPQSHKRPAEGLRHSHSRKSAQGQVSRSSHRTAQRCSGTSSAKHTPAVTESTLTSTQTCIHGQPQTRTHTLAHRRIRTRTHTQAQKETRVRAYVRTHTPSVTGMCTRRHTYLHRHGFMHLRPHARSQDTRTQTTALAHVSTHVLRHTASAHGGALQGTGSQIHMSTLMHTWAHLVTCTRTSSQISPTRPRTRR